MRPGDPQPRPAGLPAPVAVWDAHHRDWIAFHEAGAHDWLNDRVADLVHTYRVEFVLLDGPLAVVYRYQSDPATGHPYYMSDADGPTPAPAEPVIVPLPGFPPKHLLRSTTPADLRATYAHGFSGRRGLLCLRSARLREDLWPTFT